MSEGLPRRSCEVKQNLWVYGFFKTNCCVSDYKFGPRNALLAEWKRCRLHGNQEIRPPAKELDDEAKILTRTISPTLPFGSLTNTACR